MASFLQSNWGTIAVGLAVLVGLACAARTLIRDRKQGKSSCGCGCANCPSAGMCHRSAAHSR